MATKEQKKESLRDAYAISKEYARGGACTSYPGVILRDLYDKLNEIQDDIEETKD